MKSVLNKGISKVNFDKTFDKILLDKREAFYDVFLEALEDYALAKAMKEGSNSKKISRKKVFELLDKVNEG